MSLMLRPLMTLPVPRVARGVIRTSPYRISGGDEVNPDFAQPSAHKPPHGRLTRRIGVAGSPRMETGQRRRFLGSAPVAWVRRPRANGAAADAPVRLRRAPDATQGCNGSVALRSCGDIDSARRLRHEDGRRSGWPVE
jgi:hypothetical protein